MKSKNLQCTIGSLALLSAAGFLIYAGQLERSSSPSGSARATPRTTAQVRETYGQLPLSFEANRGQAIESVNFLARGPGYTLALSPTEAVFVLARGSDKPSPSPRDENGAAKRDADASRPVRSPTVLRMNIVGANRGAAVAGTNELEGRVNYFIGSDPGRWRTNIPTFGRVRYSEVFPGIDVVYYGNQKRLEYDFVVAPGREARAIALEFADAESVEVEAGTGDLLLVLGGKTIRQHKPVVYQEIEGGRREIEGRYALRSSGRVGFEVGDYDTSLALVIDPVLEYSTYLGGSSADADSDDAGNGIAVDSAGNAYVTGSTESTDFPTVNAFQSTRAGPVGSRDAFVTKINAAGSAIVYSTYLGGNSGDDGYGIAVDSAGNAYVVGSTASSDFPTANAFQNTHGGAIFDVFVTKLNSTGSALVYSSYLGGSGEDLGDGGIAVDSAGNAYVTGSTRSNNFPIANAFQSTRASGAYNAFITKFNAAGSALVYSTYLGGGGSDLALAIAVDATGSAYVTGETSSNNFPIVNALQSTLAGSFDVFVTKLNPAGSALVYSTYLGGSGSDIGDGIAVDSAGNAHVTGYTVSTDFPIANALQSTRGGGFYEAFITKFNAAGSALVYSTYLGGGGSDQGWAIAVDSAGNVYVVGSTDSTNFPTANALQSTNGGGFGDAFVTKLNAAGSALIYSTYLGGSGEDIGQGIAVDSAGNAFVTGLTDSSCFPTTTGAVDTTSSGGTDVFISKISETAPPSPLTSCTAQLLNISTRANVGTGDNVAIGGFIITGVEAKKVMLRAIKPVPTPPDPPISGTLDDPTLALHDENRTQIDFNDDWGDRPEPERTEIQNSGLQPGDLDSAMIKTLAPGLYTAIMRGKNDTTGVGLVEIYDLSPNSDSQLANISARGFVDTGDNVLIGGVIVGGSVDSLANVMVRALGPALSASGVAGPLQDPTLDLHDAQGSLIAHNDNWKEEPDGTPNATRTAQITATGLAPANDSEPAILLPLAPGVYTAIVRGKNLTTGVGLVEIYVLN